VSLAQSNANDGTARSPSSGTMHLSGTTGKTVDMSLASHVCSLPATTPMTTLTIMTGGFAITGSTVSAVSRGSGAFDAYFSSTTESSKAIYNASFTLNGNFSK
jgi:hypothetical protein